MQSEGEEMHPQRRESITLVRIPPDLDVVSRSTAMT